MIEGLIGITIVIVVMGLAIVFCKGGDTEQNEKTTASTLSEKLVPHGYTVIDRFNPLLQPIISALKVVALAVSVEHAFKRGDLEVICLVESRGRGGVGKGKRLVATIPNKVGGSEWILSSLPSIQGISRTVVIKALELALFRANFQKITSPNFDKTVMDYCDLYCRDERILPSFSPSLLNTIANCPNLILRSTDSLIIIELISLNRHTSLEQDADKLLQVTKLIADSI